MPIATLISWLLTASLGAYMLSTWVARGGLRHARARPGGLPPPLIFTHAGLALTGLLFWASYAASGWRPLAWLGVAGLMGAIGLGICTVTLWTPYPTRAPDAPSVWDETIVVPDTPAAASPGGPAEPGGEDPSAFKVTDEMIAELLADPFPARPREVRPNMTAIIPVVHGFGALTTFVLAVMTASKVLTHAPGSVIAGQSTRYTRPFDPPDHGRRPFRADTDDPARPCNEDPHSAPGYSASRRPDLRPLKSRPASLAEHGV